MKNVKHTTNSPATKTPDRENALHCFIANIDEAKALLALISEHLEDHMGADPEKVHWGHVGDASRIKLALREIAETHQLIKTQKGGSEAGRAV